MHLRLCGLGLVFAFLAAAPAAYQSPAVHEVVFPADAGVLDVTKAPFDAKGDGVTDDTAAIQKALETEPGTNKIIYLPKGTYLVSAQLRWAPNLVNNGLSFKRTILQGQSRTGTRLKLKDNAAGFGDAANRRSVIWTGNAPAQRFRNAVRDLTIDTGNGNPGAVGAQFMANNQGCLRDVIIRSGDGQGEVGLDMTYSDEIGPLLVKNLTVIGFRYGIRTGFSVNSMTFENITLMNQTVTGFFNNGQVVSIRGLTSSNTATAIYNGGAGLMTLLDTTLTGTGAAAGQPAIRNEAALLARNLTTSGYQLAVQNARGTLQNAAGPNVAEFVSHPPHSLFPTPAQSLNLPIRATPELPPDPLSEWVSPTQFGAVPNDNRDDTAAIQAAIDAGKTTVYLPNGNYTLLGNVIIRGNVRRILGAEALLAGVMQTQGVLEFADGAHPTVIIERMAGLAGGIRHASTRTLVLSSVTFGPAGSYSNTGRGDLFLEDVVGGLWSFNQQRVWARQLNTEPEGTHILNTGGRLWILGLKTERGGVIVDSRADARTEVCGAFIYATGPEKIAPMFINEDSSVSLTAGEASFAGTPFQTLVRETRDGMVKTLNRGETPARAGGSLLPLYVGYKTTAAAAVSAANYLGPALALESIASIFGEKLARETQAASTLPLPFGLAETTARLKDSTGVERPAPLFFVSPNQLNLQIPPGMAEGQATLTINSGDGAAASGTLNLTRVVPGLFSADASGRGLAAAVVLRIKADGTQVYEAAIRFDPVQNKMVAVPIDVSRPNEQVFLLLYGTGLRFRASLAAVRATLAGGDVEVLYAGSQGDFVGLDQVNLRLPQSLSGRGETEIRLTVEGKAANALTVNIR